MSRLWILILAILPLQLLAANNDEASIAHTIIMQWDSPEAPVTVSPIAVVNDHAIAGWTKAERGGRALLRKDAGNWQVYLCGGDDLSSPAYLLTAGISADDALALTSTLREMEARLPTEHRNKLSSFEGVIPVKVQKHQGHQHE